MGEVVLDSSVLLAYPDPHDAHHTEALRVVTAAVTAGDTVVLSTVAQPEVLVGAARQGPEVRAAAESRLLEAIDRLQPVDRDVAVHAAEIRARHRAVRLPDALIIATALALEGRVLTADKRWVTVDARVEVVGG